MAEYKLEGVGVRVLSPAKAVADCFKYRHEIGLDVAIDALRGWHQTKQSGLDELWR